MAGGVKEQMGFIVEVAEVQHRDRVPLTFCERPEVRLGATADPPPTSAYCLLQRHGEVGLKSP